MDSRVFFFGTADFSAPALEMLIDEGYDVVAAVTKPDSPAGRGRQLSRPLIAQLAEQNRIPVMQPQSLNQDFEAKLRELKPEVGVVVAYGKIIPQSVIDLFPKGLINIHASLLPKYRGASPIEAAILNGDNQTGVSLMQIEAGLDSGPVYAQATIQLDGSETKPDLYDRLSLLGANLLRDKLPSIVNGQLEPMPQNDDEATVAPMIKKQDGKIDWNQPAVLIERQIRAYQGWPNATSELGMIIQAHIEPTSGLKPGQISYADSKIAIGTSDNTVVVDRLKPAGKNEMTAADFLRGHQPK